MSKQWLGTVVTSTNSNPFTIQGRCHIMRMQTFYIEGNHSHVLARVLWPINRHTINGLQFWKDIVNQFLLMSMNGVHSDIGQVINRSTSTWVSPAPSACWASPWRIFQSPPRQR